MHLEKETPRSADTRHSIAHKYENRIGVLKLSSPYKLLSNHLIFVNYLGNYDSGINARLVNWVAATLMEKTVAFRLGIWTLEMSQDQYDTRLIPSVLLFTFLCVCERSGWPRGQNVRLTQRGTCGSFPGNVGIFTYRR